MARPGPGREQDRGRRRRRSIVEAAAGIILAEGPGAVSHRAVAERAGVPLSATTYYFSGLDELLDAAATYLMERWAERAETVREERVRSRAGTEPRQAEPGSAAGPGHAIEPETTEPKVDTGSGLAAEPGRAIEPEIATEPEELVDADAVVAAVVDALLPVPGEVRGHYAQLLAAGETPAVARAYRSGRARLDTAVGDILRDGGSACPPALAVAVVDGAVVSALSEGRDVRLTATSLLRQVV